MSKISIFALLLITLLVSIIHSQQIRNPKQRISSAVTSDDVDQEEDLNDFTPTATRPTGIRRRPNPRPRPDAVPVIDESLDNEVVTATNGLTTKRRGGNVAHNNPSSSVDPTVGVPDGNVDGTGGAGTAVGTFGNNVKGSVGGGNGGEGANIINKDGGGLNRGGTGGSGSAVATFGTNSEGEVAGGNGGTGGSITSAGGGINQGGDGGTGSAVATFGTGSFGVVSGGNGGAGGSVVTAGGGVIRAGNGGNGFAQATFG